MNQLRQSQTRTTTRTHHIILNSTKLINAINRQRLYVFFVSWNQYEKDTLIRWFVFVFSFWFYYVLFIVILYIIWIYYCYKCIPTNNYSIYPLLVLPFHIHSFDRPKTKIVIIILLFRPTCVVGVVTKVLLSNIPIYVCIVLPSNRWFIRLLLIFPCRSIFIRSVPFRLHNLKIVKSISLMGYLMP